MFSFTNVQYFSVTFICLSNLILFGLQLSQEQSNASEPVENASVKLQTWAESVKSLEKEKQPTSTQTTQSAVTTPSQAAQSQGSKPKSTPQQVLARVHQLLEVILNKSF